MRRGLRGAVPLGCAVVLSVACGGGGFAPPEEEPSASALDQQPALRRVPARACDEATPRRDGAALVAELGCQGARLELRPTVRVDGVWRGAGIDGPCRDEGTSVSCPAGSLGVVRALEEGNDLRVVFEATAGVLVTGIGLVGSGRLPGAAGWLSQGLQSWSQSGVLALRGAPRGEALEAALAAAGEDEVYRRGQHASYWYTHVGGGVADAFAGAVTAERLRTWTEVSRVAGDDVFLRIASGGQDTVRLSPGETLSSELYRVRVTSQLHRTLGEYGLALASRRRSVRAPAPAGWNSWYDLWNDVDAEDVLAPAGRSNTDQARDWFARRAPGTPVHIVVDDGWQRAWGDWDTNDKFPGGIAALARELRARGVVPGLWLAPFAVHPRSELARRHPDWLVAGAGWNQPGQGDLKVLDVTHPEAAAHLTAVLRRLKADGITLFKVDFLFAQLLPGRRREDITPLQAYHRGMALLRDSVGEDAFLLAVGAPPLPTFPYVDGWRVGNDIAFKPAFLGLPKPSWGFIANQMRQIAARWPLCLATLCDADPALLRELPREQVEAGAWVAAAAGGALFLSDDLRRLAAERKQWGWDAERVSAALSGVPAIPETLYPSRLPDDLVNMKDFFFPPDHEAPVTYRLPSGARLAINLRPGVVVVEGTSLPGRSARLLPGPSLAPWVPPAP